MGRIPAFYDFSETKWRVEKDSDNESEEDEWDGEEERVIYRGEFSQQVEPVSVPSSAVTALDVQRQELSETVHAQEANQTRNQDVV